MGISSTIDERRRALIARIDDPPEPDMEVFSTIKKMLNDSFGEENNQILRGIQENKDYYKRRISEVSNDYFRSYPDERIWRDTIGEVADFTVVIRFPLVTITNDSKESHEIRDLWVRFFITGKGHIVGTLMGTRTSVTPEEQIASYRHSHLGTSKGSGWSGYCLGSGPLAMMIPMMRNTFKPGQFQLFLFNIKEYVKWESISGTPYIRMNTIKNRTGTVTASIMTIRQDTRETYIEHALTCLRGVSTEYLNANLEVRIEGNQFKVTITEDFEFWITDYFCSASALRYINLTQFMCYKNTDGKYVSGVIADVSLPYQSVPTFIFKGEPQFLKLINKEENVKESRKYLHPVFKYELENRLSNYFNTSYSAYSRDEK